MPSYERNTTVKRLDHTSATSSGNKSHAEIDRLLDDLHGLVSATDVNARLEATVTGPVFVGSKVVPSYPVPVNCTAASVYARVNQNPTTTSNVVVSVKYDGSVIGTLTITPTATNGWSNTLTTSDLTVSAFVARKFIDIDVTSIGEVTPGSDLTVYIEI